MIQNGQGAAAAMEIVVSFGAGKFKGPLLYSPDSSAYRGAWQQTIAAAEEANDPGRFTAFIGYEWTSNTGGNNLHRNVIFRDGADKASQVVPFTTLPPGSDNPRDLWKWLQNYEDKTGGEVLAIAHNGNLSNGTMFPIIKSFTGKEIDREYAEQRARWEVLYEATQMKGDGETHPLLSPNDEFANFERWDKANLDLTAAEEAGDAGVRVRALGAQERAQARSQAWRKPLQVRAGRQHRRPHRACHGRRRQLLGQGNEFGAQPRPGYSSAFQQSEDRHPGHGLGRNGVRLCGRVG